jgi:hypothetical protein
MLAYPAQFMCNSNYYRGRLQDWFFMPGSGTYSGWTVISGGVIAWQSVMFTLVPSNAMMPMV